MSGWSAIAKNELRILRNDPAYAITFLAMPLVTMIMFKGVSKVFLSEAGYRHANGSELAVSGAIVFFSFFLVGNLGFGVFREHGWNTWQRLRASPTRPAVILAGKTSVPMVVLLLQMATLTIAGWLLLGLDIRGSIAGFVAVLLSLAVCLGGIGLALLSICRTIVQLNLAANLGAVVLGSLGGALVPVETLPSWARFVAHGLPTYWAMEALRALTLNDASLTDVLPNIAVLLGFGLAGALLALKKLSLSDPKIGWG